MVPFSESSVTRLLFLTSETDSDQQHSELKRLYIRF